MSALKIGPIAVDPPVVLAPMAGVTNRAFRQLCRRYGAGLYVSEMITARALVEGSARTRRMLEFGPDESPRSVQLYGVDPAVVGAAARMLVDEVGVDHIDMNFGCPAPKVTRKGGGAALPLHPVLYRRVIAAAVAAAGTVPVTVKFRTGLDAAHRSAVTAGCIAENEGAAAVALHARNAEQRYAGPADWSEITALKGAVTSIPVLGNGDIWEASDALAMMAVTGCDGVVVGRGCLGRPWLFADLSDAFAGRPPAKPPDLGVIRGVMLDHARLLVSSDAADTDRNGHGIRDFRKHTGWYLAGFPIGGARRRALAQVSSFAELEGLLGDLDATMPFPQAALRLPRGHTDGPRPVALPAGWLDNRDDPTPPAGADDAVSGG